ncbi:2-hydroxychromene-2-carboxylate isomerase [Thalassobaculum fulvum]|uniref:2-hydroxychromene-2-carboxylate isomerase n=1 Tax=Thalassobaculum fulvum TaxID=1633335 RepID=A0A919CMG3_9PROT|nr:2-hydroxychromene-2-carboxylate isomerase [Thalassobaculum fulvum]GHD39082.1 2-hydroxychromene-2-carboxylate isomerase [Thalassobaculum fulvum]
MSIAIDYYFSTSSPWTYLGSGRFIEIVDRIGATVNVCPVDFGPIFAQSGGLPLPKRAPQRQAYRMMELKRWRDYLGIPIVLEPKNFPLTAPLAAYTIIAARETGKDRAWHDALILSDALLTALWRDDRDLGNPDEVVAVANAVGQDGHVLVNAAPGYADTFRADTEKAAAEGVFGAPSWKLPDGEIFWGQDRIDLLRWRLGA